MVTICRCGAPAKDDGKCDRCRYYATIFTPPIPQFESKRDKAKRAIQDRKKTKGIVKWQTA